MDLKPETTRYVYHTKGVCPPEIHFERRGDSIHGLRFVGGGCPGNAQFVSRMIEGRSFAYVLEIAGNIPCRNGTSFPDQLAEAVRLVLEGKLEPAPSFRVFGEETAMHRVCLIGDLGGDPDVLKQALDRARSVKTDSVFCLGNLTGPSARNHEVITLAIKEGIVAALGEQDWNNIEALLKSKVVALSGEDRIDVIVVSDDAGTEQVIPVDGVFMAVGWVPNVDLLEFFVETVPDGYIKTNERLMTSVPGLFAAGDVRNTDLRQVITACADGARAATYALEFLQGRTR